MVNLNSKRSKRNYLRENFTYEINELLNFKFLDEKVKRADEISNFGTGIIRIYNNTKLEHALLHIRNLYEFFFLPPSRTRYPRAEDFVDKKKFRPIYNGQYGNKTYVRYGRYLNRSFWKKVNNQVVHLGSERTLNKMKKRWYLERIVTDLLKISNEFICKLDTYYLAKEGKQMSRLVILSEKITRELS